jgi:Holliday junction resolvase RusA-like endonuclease
VEWGNTAFCAIADARNKSYLQSQCEMCLWKNLTRAKVVVTFVIENNRRIDTDNLEGQAMKPVWDAMVRCGLITDDRHQVIYERTYKAVVDKERGPMTIVEVKEGA